MNYLQKVGNNTPIKEEKELELKMKQKNTRKECKNASGITLIALVVTIVVLLILAGITINYVFSEGGLFDTAKNSGNTWQDAQNSDLNALNDLNGMIGNLVNGTGSGGASSGMPEATINIVGDPEWSNNKAKIYIESSDKVNTLQYQILTIVDGMETNEDGWISYDNTVGITDIEYGQVVYARMFDGYNGGPEVPLEIIDGIPPEEATFGTFSKTNPEPNETITVNVTHKDDQSNVNITSCKWVYVKQNERTPIGTNQDDYTDGTFGTNGEQLNLTATEEGTYYLHILTIDNAGNKKESISNAITVVNIRVSGIQFTPNTETITIGEELTKTPTILPDNAKNKTLTWTSSNPDVASVDANTGKVTGVAIGETTITATATDESGVAGSYTVTVKELVTNNNLKEIDTVKNREAIDIYGNEVIIPKGFKIAEDSGLTVPEGIVIEDGASTSTTTGNQFVWIPVGTVYMNEERTVTKQVQLGRYTFDGSTGAPKLKQAAFNENEVENYTEEVSINEFYELSTSREGTMINATSQGNLNATAKELGVFLTSAKNNYGYYIARYEASYGSGYNTGTGADWSASKLYGNAKPLSKISTANKFNSSHVGSLWNQITQMNASKVARNMYKKDNMFGVESDLINSYAWDTAIVYISQMKEEYANFANFKGSTTINGDAIGWETKNTGTNNVDKFCNIYDMVSNCDEWTTEYHYQRVVPGERSVCL